MPKKSRPSNKASFIILFAVVALIAFALVGMIGQMYLAESTDSRSQAAAAPIQSGWDFGMKKLCLTSLNPSAANYFSIMNGCSPTNRHWLIAVQSEKDFSATCTGPTNQSIPVYNMKNVTTAAPGPLTFNWLNRTGSLGAAYSVNLKSNFVDRQHPCGKDAFTWYVLMDHTLGGGGPHFQPNVVKHSFIANYNDYTPNGAARMFSGIRFIAGGVTYEIEMNHVLTGWGDAYPQDPEIIQKDVNSSRTYIALDARAFNLALPKTRETRMTVPWGQVIDRLISKGTIARPASWTDSVTQGLFVGEETKTGAATNSVVSDLWITDWQETK